MFGSTLLSHGLQIFLLAFGLTYVLTPVVERYSKRWQLLDIPSGRKVHQTPVPRSGGVAIGVGVAATLPAHAASAQCNTRSSLDSSL